MTRKQDQSLIKAFHEFRLQHQDAIDQERAEVERKLREFLPAPIVALFRQDAYVIDNILDTGMTARQYFLRDKKRFGYSDMGELKLWLEQLADIWQGQVRIDIQEQAIIHGQVTCLTVYFHAC